MHLGEAPHPDTNSVEANLPLAKQNVDLLGLMKEKTKGNLTGDGACPCAGALNLRMRYVERSKGSSK